MIPEKLMILANLTQAMNSRKMFILPVLAAMLLALPVLAQSMNGNAAAKLNAAKDKVAQTTFCQKLTALENRLNGKSSQNKEKVQAKIQERIKKWEDNVAQRDAKKEQVRIQAEENLEKHFSALEAKAQTEEQKTAVTNFENEIKAAVATRQEAFDKAVKEFRLAVKNMQTQRQTTTQQEMSTFISNQSAAFSKAQTDCQNGVDSETVKADLKTSLASSKSQFQAARKNVQENRTQMQNLIQTRNQAITQARTTFRNTVEAAGKKLKAVFSDTTSASGTDAETKASDATVTD